MPRNVFLSLIVPVYNEEKRLEASLPEVVNFLSQAFDRWEILYSDDGSTDGTRTLIHSLQRKDPLIRLVGTTDNRGKGSAVRTGMEAAMGDILLFSDADFSTPISELEKLLQSLDSGNDIAIGSRGLPGSSIEVRQSWGRETMGKTFNHLLRNLLPLPFHDTQCGFKAFRREAAMAILPQLHIDGFAFDVEMLIVAQVNGLKIAEIPVVWRNALDSKVHPIRSSIHMLSDVFRIRYRLGMSQYSQRSSISTLH